MTARIIRVAGSLVEAAPLHGALYELAFVGKRRLLGEIIKQRGDVCTLQVYESTTGLAVGEPVEHTGVSLTAQLGPGLLGAVLDGIGRPLERVAEATGDFIAPGSTRIKSGPLPPRARPAIRWNPATCSALCSSAQSPTACSFHRACAA